MTEKNVENLANVWNECDNLMDVMRDFQNQVKDLKNHAEVLNKYPQFDWILTNAETICDLFDSMADAVDEIQDDLSSKLTAIEDEEFEKETQRQVAEYNQQNNM